MSAEEFDPDTAMGINVGEHDGVLVIAFPKEVRWLGFHIENARSFAYTILAKATEIEEALRMDPRGNA